MKFLVLLSVLGLAFADPQVIHHPGQHLFQPFPLTTLTPTIKTSDSGVISTYTAAYPYAGIPHIQASMPYTFGYPFMSYPTLITNTPIEDSTTARQKRSADPEPAINFPKVGDIRLLSPEGEPAVAAIQKPTVATVPAPTIQYMRLPAYTMPAQTITHTGLTPVAGYPYSGLTWSGLNPYTTFPWFQTPLSTTNIVTPTVEGSQ